MTILLRATALGLATGSRSTLGIAALALTAPRPGRLRPRSSWLDSKWTARVAALACAGELVGDKLPKTPSRLEKPGVASRLVLGAVSGAVLAHRDGQSTGRTVTAAGLAVAGAALSTRAAAAWRAAASAKFGPDLPGAFIEDGVAIAVAGLAVS